MVAPEGKREARYCDVCKKHQIKVRHNSFGGWQCLWCFDYEHDPPPPLWAFLLSGAVSLAILWFLWSLK